ncbi:MAG: pyridoxal-phosphate dependent enzyme [candidate division Zixibacteria bacterium]|nr:pyridoxal-phosphate dependent enzyme [candidate division Zixibacteria bacterium]
MDDKCILPPKADIARIPTPVEPLMNVPFDMNGCEIYIKRDDLTGSLLQGNKIRKLEYFLSDIKSQKAGILISCGGLQSNHCRAVAALASRVNLKSVLFLRGREPEVPSANVLIDKLVGAEIKYVTAPEYFRIEEIMADYAEKLREKGFNPYIIPEGGSNALGLCGYFNCYNEIREWSGENNIHFDYIITATGSGGTYGGLIAANRYYGDHTAIIGINVCYTSDHFINRISKYIAGFKKAYCPELDVRRRDFRIYDGFVGNGYALSRREELVVLRDLCKASGIMLDPVYTGKAFFGMLDLMRKRIIPPKSQVLFLHTGGIWGVMAIGERFKKYELI